MRRKIIQAPLAGVQGFELASAVHNAGGLGSIPCAMLSIEQIQQQFRAFQAATRQEEDRMVQVNLNFFAHKQEALDPNKIDVWRQTLQPYFDELKISPHSDKPASSERKSFNKEHLDLVERLKPSVVSFHFGLPALDQVSRLRHLGIQVWSTATTVEEAVWLDQVGEVDAIIAQGSEAGGHRGTFLSSTQEQQLELEDLLPQVLANTQKPVIAAGCCAENNPNKWFALGANAIQIGSCFLLTAECKLSAVHRKALLLSQEQHSETEITNVFTGKPARGLATRFVREQGPISPNTPGFPHTSNLVSLLKIEAEKHGSADFTAAWRGKYWKDYANESDAASVIKTVFNKLH